MKSFLTLLFIWFSLTPGFSFLLHPEPIAQVYPVEEVVYVTKTGSKYHRGSCHYLKKSKYKKSKSEAIRSGYSACSVCRP